MHHLKMNTSPETVALELRQTADWLQSELPNHQLSWEKFVASKAAARLTVRERRDLAQSFGSAPSPAGNL